mmetsp:Transcript_20500/g.48593  ORF Transcript_20500/g.48593 Transcript_20500/m.48593 type:complete len:237 (+) Transcript_20500:170-880(+)
MHSQLRGETAHNMLDARVLIEAVGAQVLAVAALLEAAVWHLRDEGDVRINPHATEVEGARAAQCAAMVGRPHRGGQPELDAVGHGNGLSLVGEGLHGDHRPEDLLLDQLVLLPQPRHHRGGDEEAGPGDGRTAGDDPSMRGHTREEALNALELHAAVKRAHQHVLRVHARRRARLDVRGRLLGQQRHDLLVRRRLDDHARRGGAVLPRIEEPRHSDVSRGGGEVGVSEDHHRRLPS